MKRPQKTKETPPRTLLQELFPRTGGTQASQQTLHTVDNTAGYIHVTQLWSVMLEGDGEGTVLVKFGPDLH